MKNWLRRIRYFGLRRAIWLWQMDRLLGHVAQQFRTTGEKTEELTGQILDLSKVTGRYGGRP